MNIEIVDNAKRLHGHWMVDIIRNGRVVERALADNLVVDEGWNYMLNAGIAAQTQILSWYCALFSNNYTPTAGLTAATFTATAGEFVLYDEVARPQYSPAVSTAKSLTNAASRAQFTVTVATPATNIYGLAILSATAKSSTLGTCLSCARFSVTPRSVIGGDIVLATYILNAS